MPIEPIEPSEPEGLAALSDEERNEFEHLLFAFDGSWTAEAFQTRTADLQSRPDPFRLAAYEEMAKVDLERGWRNGLQRTVQQYLDWQPELADEPGAQLRMLQVEFETRSQFDPEFDVAAFETHWGVNTADWRELPETPDLTVSLASGDTGESAHDERSRPTLPLALGPRYLLMAELGCGGMGAVYRAQDQKMKRDVAIKIPHAHVPFQRSENEAHAVAKLQHPNICDVYDIDRVDQTPYLSMQLITGPTLTAWIQERQPVPPVQAVRLVQKVARALHYAHGRGVLHRDLKPSNILINDQGEPIVTDFGLARFEKAPGESEADPRGPASGTPCYVAPETLDARQDDLKPAGDIYSLGCVLFEMLAGRPPFEGTGMSVLQKVAFSDPPQVTELRKDVPPRVAEVCHKMMAKRPEHRYKSMAAAADALQESLADTEAASAKPKVLTETSTAWKRPGVPQVIAALAGIAIVALLTVFFVQWGKTTLRIEVLDESLAVTISQKRITVDNSGATIIIEPGATHDFKVYRGNLVVESDSIQLKRGQKETLKIAVDNSDRVVVSTDGKPVHFKRNPLQPTYRRRVIAGVVSPSNRQGPGWRARRQDGKTIVTFPDGGFVSGPLVMIGVRAGANRGRVVRPAAIGESDFATLEEHFEFVAIQTRPDSTGVSPPRKGWRATGAILIGRGHEITRRQRGEGWSLTRDAIRTTVTLPQRFSEPPIVWVADGDWHMRLPKTPLDLYRRPQSVGAEAFAFVFPVVSDFVVLGLQPAQSKADARRHSVNPGKRLLTGRATRKADAGRGWTSRWEGRQTVVTFDTPYPRAPIVFVTETAPTAYLRRPISVREKGFVAEGQAVEFVVFPH